MFRSLLPASPRSLGTWCAYVLILITPGSFIVLPLLWLGRMMAKRLDHA